MELSTVEVNVCGLLFFSFKKGLLVAMGVASMRVTVAVAMAVIVAMSVNVVMCIKDRHLDNIEDEAGNSGNKHNVFLDLRGVQESCIGSKKEPDGDAPEESKRKESSDNLGSVVTKGHSVYSLSFCQLDSHDGNTEAEHVGSQMCSV